MPPPPPEFGDSERKRKGKAQPFPKQRIRTYNKQVILEVCIVSFLASLYLYLLVVKNNLMAENQFAICIFRNLLLDSLSKKKCLNLLFIEQSDLKRPLNQREIEKGEAQSSVQFIFPT